MLKLGNKIILTSSELDIAKYDHYKKIEKEVRKEIRDSLEADYKRYKNSLKEEYEEKLDTRDDTIKNQKKTIKRITEELGDANARVDVLEADRDDVREVVAKELELKDLNAVLEAKKETQDKRDARLKDREAKLGTEEDKSYKSGYADGVADGVRKVNEITQKDRDNTAKIAMIAASSHTPIANLKELNNVHQLTAGTEDSQVTES